MASSGEGIVLGGENGWAVAGAANSVWYLEHAALPAVTGETPTVFPSPQKKRWTRALLLAADASSTGNAALGADAGRLA